MATHETPVRNVLADAAVDQLDEGTPPGLLVFRTAADAVLATLNYAAPNAYGDAAGGVATANPIPQGTITADGIATKATNENAAATIKFTCSVSSTGGGGEIQLTNNNLQTGNPLTITSLTYTASP